MIKLIFGAQELCKWEENRNWNKNYEAFNAIEKFISYIVHHIFHFATFFSKDPFITVMQKRDFIYIFKIDL